MNSPQPTIRSGEKIPLLDGTNDALLFDRSYLNKLVMVANAILANPGWVITDNGIINPGSGKGGNTGTGLLNYIGAWNQDQLFGKDFKPGDLVLMDNAVDNTHLYFGGNTQYLNLSAVAGATPVTFSDGATAAGTVKIGWYWIIRCINPVTQNINLLLSYPNGMDGLPQINSGDWVPFCIGRIGIKIV
jgi:hypothetical protein